MIEILIVATLVGVLGGWLWCSDDAHLLDPIKIRTVSKVGDLVLEMEVMDHPPRFRYGLLTWLHQRLACPPCMGSEWSLVALLMLDGWHWRTLPLLGASIALHVAYMEWLGRQHFKTGLTVKAEKRFAANHEANMARHKEHKQ